MAKKLIVKDPDEKLDYTVDFAPLTNSRTGAASDWLPSGDTLATFSITVATGLILATSPAAQLTDTNTSVTLWLEGGTDGSLYNVQVDVVTANSREGSRSFDVLIESK